ncbi:polymer-forming cytoskeletal protein [Natronomonas sp. LN261]|uniref:bactofilin family protein n=1 Tax=Natronomonas sp. LN261 TaxID=2750669 RepID=UPI0015EFC296|nr:polymer-forming cytoskeletal protein [Natronomonas sp. LN261]
MRRQSALLLGLSFVVAVALVPGIAAAETLVGGSVVVDADETVGDTSATGGTVVVEGTVDGDLKAYGGSVHVAEGGEVTGIVRAYGGTVTVDGSVGGNVLAYGGSVRVGETAEIDRSFGAVAGDVTLEGRIGGDVAAVAGEITLAETALVEGSLNHFGDLREEGGTVEGVVQDGSDLALGPPTEIVTALLAVAAVVGDLLLGAVLVRVSPRFADSATDTVRTEPVYTLAVGLAATVGTLAVIAVLAVTIVGLPLAVGALASSLLLAWVARVYGQYVVGAIVLSLTAYGNRYLALLVGVLGVTVLGIVPYLGAAVSVVVFGLGAGVVALGGHSLWRLVTDRPGGLADI